MTRDPKPATKDSWWMSAARDGFTKQAEVVFQIQESQTKPKTSGLALWPHQKRESAA